MGKSCQGLLKTYVKCLRESKCVKIEGKEIEQCLQTEECMPFRNSYFVCKRGQVDMRTRIRGSKGY